MTSANNFKNKIQISKIIDLIGHDFFAISASAGSTKNGRDSKSKRLGVKIFGNGLVKAGNIIIRQKGRKFSISRTDINHKRLKFGSNFDIIALSDGRVKFYSKKVRNRLNSKRVKKQMFVTII